jgi:hypothetical protein
MSENNALSNIVAGVKNQLSLIDGDSGPRESLFPVAFQKAERDMFSVDDEENLKVLKNQEDIVGVYLAHRFTCIIHPDVYDTSKSSEEQEKPIGGGVVPPELHGVLKSACEALQYTKAMDRSARFNYNDTGAGLPSAALEVLIYSPAARAIVVVRPYSNYNGLFKKGKTLEALLSMANEEGSLDPITMKFTAKVEQQSWKGSKPLAWVGLEALPDGKAKAEVVKAFAAVAAEWQAEEGQDTIAAMNKWVAGEDNPLGESDAEKLRIAASKKW